MPKSIKEDVSKISSVIRKPFIKARKIRRHSKRPHPRISWAWSFWRWKSIKNISTFPNYSKFFKPNCSNKPFLVDLSQLYSNLFLKIVKFKGALPESESTSVKTNISERKVENKYGETEVRKICQKQKMLSDGELIEIATKYLSGVLYKRNRPADYSET